jgi:hypothetical protein
MQKDGPLEKRGVFQRPANGFFDQFDKDMMALIKWKNE